MDASNEDAVRILAGEAKYPTAWKYSNSRVNKVERDTIGRKTWRPWLKCCGSRLRLAYREYMNCSGESAPEGSRLRTISRHYKGLMCTNCDYFRGY